MRTAIGWTPSTTRRSLYAHRNLPINRRLESPELDLRSEEAVRLLQRWGRLHAVRSLLSAVAFLAFLFVLIAHK